MPSLLLHCGKSSFPKCTVPSSHKLQEISVPKTAIDASRSLITAIHFKVGLILHKIMAWGHKVILLILPHSLHFDGFLLHDLISVNLYINHPVLWCNLWHMKTSVDYTSVTLKELSKAECHLILKHGTRKFSQCVRSNAVRDTYH